MPYFFLSDEMPEERPTGPLLGYYDPAKARVPLRELPDAAVSPVSGIRGIFNRIFPLKSSANDAPGLATLRVVTVLRGLGFHAIECRYDGGNDEGFAYFDSASSDEATLSLIQVVERLKGTELGEPTFDLYGRLPEMTEEQRNEYLNWMSKRTQEERIHEVLESLATEVSVALLGEGYGTGEYAMAGRFRFDLQTGKVIDLTMSPPPDFRESGAFSLDDFYADSEDS